jgi:hypothetical protein
VLFDTPCLATGEPVFRAERGDRTEVVGRNPLALSERVVNDMSQAGRCQRGSLGALAAPCARLAPP